jgi:hypothetical protein
MELSKLAIVGLTLIGLGGVILAAYAVYRISQRVPCPPDPVRATQPVPDTTEQPQDTLHIVGRNALGKASGL